MQTSGMNKKVADAVRKEMLRAAEKIADAYGLDVTEQRASYSDDDVKLKITLTCRQDGKSGKEVEFAKYCKYFCLQESDYGRTFRDHFGHEWAIMGIRPKARKNTVIIENRAGQQYAMPHLRVVHYLLAKQEKEAANGE